jgi:hypothetical protein
VLLLVASHTKEFANYICIGEGSGEIAVCVTECGATSTVGDVMASSYVEAQLYLIIGLLFDYWYAPRPTVWDSSQTPNPCE